MLVENHIKKISNHHQLWYDWTIEYMLCMFAVLYLTSKINVSNPHSLGLTSSQRDEGIPLVVEIHYIFIEFVFQLI